MTEINIEPITKALQAEFGPLLAKANGSELGYPEITFLEFLRAFQLVTAKEENLADSDESDEKKVKQKKLLETIDQQQVQLEVDGKKQDFVVKIGDKAEKVSGGYVKKLMRIAQNRLYRPRSTVVERSRLQTQWRINNTAQQRLRDGIKITLVSMGDWEEIQRKEANLKYQERQRERQAIKSKKQSRAERKLLIKEALVNSVIEELLDENPKEAFLEITSGSPLLSVYPEDKIKLANIADNFVAGELLELRIGFGANVTGEYNFVADTDIRNLAYVLPALESLKKLKQIAERDGLQIPTLTIYFADGFLRKVLPDIAKNIQTSSYAVANLLENFISIFYSELLGYVSFDFEPINLNEVYEDPVFCRLVSVLKQNNDLAPPLIELSKKYAGDPFEYAILHAYYAGDFDQNSKNTIMIGGPSEALFNQTRIWIQEYLETNNKNPQLFQKTGAQPPYLRTLSGYSVRQIAKVGEKIPRYLNKPDTPAGYDLAILNKYFDDKEIVTFCQLVLNR